MKKKLTAKDLIDLYEKCYKNIEDAELNGDYRLNNKAANKLVKLIKIYFKEDLDLAKEVYGHFLKSGSPTARSLTAANCLKLGILIEDAIRVLEELSKGNHYMVSFNAEMTLKVWRGEFSGKIL